MNIFNDDTNELSSASEDLMASTQPVTDDMVKIFDDMHWNTSDLQLPWDADGNLGNSECIVGTPETDTQLWQPQTTAFTCAVVAQRGIIEAYTGEDISEAQLVYEATANGWLTDHGMSPADIGNLLELNGIPCHSRTHATVEDLITELSQGHKVIVGVNSSEIWGTENPSGQPVFGEVADHAIWVTGVDMTDPDNPKVFINDSGTPDGAGKVYDLATFVDAWEDSGYFYVSTDHPPPDLHLSASGFDPATGTFPEMVNYFSKYDPDFDQAVHGKAHEERAESAGAQHVSGEQHDKEWLGAGTCSHCGGAGYTTYPSSGSQERCWYCGGSGVAS